MVVIGGGFGGLQAVQKLARAPVDVTLIDRRNFHLFQPLTYQVATGALSARGGRLSAARDLQAAPQCSRLLAEVREVDLEAGRCRSSPARASAARSTIPYDTLIAAGGSRYSYFGHDEWQAYAHEVKSLESALDVRSAILGAFEAAELEPDPERAASLADLRGRRRRADRGGDGRPDRRDRPRHAATRLPGDRPAQGRVLLVEMADRVLTTFPPSLSEKAARSLEQLGVRHCSATRSSTSTTTASRSRPAAEPRAHPGADRHLGRRRHGGRRSPGGWARRPAPRSTGPGGSRSDPI